MHKYLYPLLVSILLFTACNTKQNNGNYFSKDKWRTTYSDHSSLKGSPKEVYEYPQDGITDINQKILSNQTPYVYTKFNVTGNIVEINKHVAEDSGIVYAYDYTDNGYDRNIFYESNPNYKIPEIEFKRIDANTFQRKNFLSAGRTDLFKFSDDGNEITRIDTSTEIGGTKQKIIENYLYNGQLLLEHDYFSEELSTSNKISTKYFYSSMNFLDSIITQSKGYNTKNLMVNNKKGDAILEYFIKNGDTLGVYKSEFIYDVKNNWTRKLVIYKERKRDDSDKLIELPETYTLIKRYIIYALRSE